MVDTPLTRRGMKATMILAQTSAGLWLSYEIQQSLDRLRDAEEELTLSRICTHGEPTDVSGEEMTHLVAASSAGIACGTELDLLSKVAATLETMGISA